MKQVTINWTCDQCSKAVTGDVYRLHLAAIERNNTLLNQEVCGDCAAKISEKYTEPVTSAVLEELAEIIEAPEGI